MSLCRYIAVGNPFLDTVPRQITYGRWISWDLGCTSTGESLDQLSWRQRAWIPRLNLPAKADCFLLPDICCDISCPKIGQYPEFIGCFRSNCHFEVNILFLSLQTQTSYFRILLPARCKSTQELGEIHRVRRATFSYRRMLSAESRAARKSPFAYASTPKPSFLLIELSWWFWVKSKRSWVLGEVPRPVWRVEDELFGPVLYLRTWGKIN